MIAHYQRMFRYEQWANGEALAAVQACPQTPPRALQLLAHVASSQLLWLARVKGEEPPMKIWPELTADQVAEELVNASQNWRSLLAASDLERPVAYANSKGERFTGSLGSIVDHVLLHGAYHRGQVAQTVRSAGGEPAYTDFIHAARQGLI